MKTLLAVIFLAHFVALISGQCENSPDGTWVPHSKFCTHFYYCQDGEAHEGICANGLHFRQNPPACTYSANAKCVIENGGGGEEKLCQPGEVSWRQHETSCSSYYLCFFGDLQLVRCVEGLHWNQERLQCVPLHYSNCLIDEPECPEVDEPGVIVHIPSRERCDVYFICMGGTAIRSQCAPGLYFNPILNTCDQPKNVNCQIGGGSRIKREE